MNEKEKELSDLKEVSQQLIQKEKKQIEQLNIVDPNKCKIITDKKYKKLTWYLIYEKSMENNNGQGDEENMYENYRWVNGTIIKKDKFNKYDTDEDKLKDLNEYILALQKKLEKKEESYSKLDLQNKKLIKEIHNKTAGNALLHHLSSGNTSQVKNTSIDVGNAGFKNILEELNKSNVREKKLQDKIIKLNNQLKDKDINKNENEINDNSKKDDIDELNQAQEQLILLKEELKDTQTKLDQLVGQVKELLKNVKCDMKIKPQFVQICQILQLSPQTTNRIITNNKKVIIL